MGLFFTEHEKGKTITDFFPISSIVNQQTELITTIRIYNERMFLFNLSPLHLRSVDGIYEV